MCGSGSVFGIRIQEAPEYGKIRIRIHNTVKKLLFFPKPIISPCLSSLCRWWSEDSAACPSACRRDCCRASHWPAVVSIWTSSGPAPPCSSLNMHNSGSYRAPNNHNNKDITIWHHRPLWTGTVADQDPFHANLILKLRIVQIPMPVVLFHT